MLSPSNKPNVETLSDMNNDKRFIMGIFTI